MKIGNLIQKIKIINPIEAQQLRIYFNFNKLFANINCKQTQFFCNSFHQAKQMQFLHFSKFKFSKQNYLPLQQKESLPLVRLNTICDNPGARKKRKKVGRGPGNGRGKTSGRGHKGMQRSYKPPVHIQGGQTPFHRSVPKFGRKINPAELFTEINIKNLYYLITKNRIDCSKQINIRDICKSGAVSKLRQRGIKLLGKGLEKLDLLPPLDIVVSSASQSVIDKIKERGGKITCKYLSEKALMCEAMPYKFIKVPLNEQPKYRHVVYYNKLEKMGAIVVYPKPVWMATNQYQEFMEKFNKLKKLVENSPDAHLLPTFPIPRGTKSNRVRIQNRVRPRNYTFDAK